MGAVGPPPFTGPPDPNADDYPARLIRTLLAVLNHPIPFATDVYRAAERDAVKAGGVHNAVLKVFADYGVNPGQLADLLGGGAFPLVAWVLSFVTGLNFTGDQLQNLATGPNDQVKREALGRILTNLYAETLDTTKPAQGWLNRNPGDAELENFKQLSGAAMRLALSDILLDWIGGAIPLGLAKGLEEIADKINDAVALDDALEEVVQVPMQAVIQRGLEAKYNRELKPQDYTESEARQAYLRESITKDVYDKVLDNQGVRDDIRDVLLDIAEPNLTESDLDQLYQHNILSIEQISDQYKQKGFRPETRKLKTDLVEKTRRWKLEQQILELYGNLYRDDVALKAEVTPFLEHLGYEPDEQEMWFQVQELERRQRKWLSAQQTHNLAKAGLVKPEFLIEYEVKQGMLPEDAMLLYMNQLLALFPAPEPAPGQPPNECAQIIKDAFTLDKAISALVGLIPTFDTKGIFSTGDVAKLLKCLIEQAKTP